MSVDKLVDSSQLNADLTTIANAIRTKGGTSAQLSFPSGMAQAIADIPSGGGTNFLNYIKDGANLFSGVDLRGLGKIVINSSALSTLSWAFGNSKVDDLEINIPSNNTNAINFGYMFYNGAISNGGLKITGDLSRITNYSWMFYGFSFATTIDFEIDFTGVTSDQAMGIGWVFANTPGKYPTVKKSSLSRNISIGTNMTALQPLPATELVNGLNKASAHSFTASVGDKAKLSTWMGTVSVDGSGNDVFTYDPTNGTVSMEYFVTQIKGWTLA